jgi:ADP-ribosylglycohydrolase
MDIIKGLIYGCALGDAFGVQAEAMDKEELKRKYPTGITGMSFNTVRGIHCGDWTDDTDQMILLMESIDISNQSKYNNANTTQSNNNTNNTKYNTLQYSLYEKTFAKKLKHWKNHGFGELGDLAGMGLGQLTARVISHDAFLTNPYLASRETHKLLHDRIPNGGVMRTAICGLFPNWMELATRQCQVTHWHSECVISCQFVCWMIRQCLKTKANSRYRMKHPLYFVNKYVAEEHRDKLKKYVCQDLKDLNLDERHTWGYTYKATGCAVWVYLRIRQCDKKYASVDENSTAGNNITENKNSNNLAGDLTNELGESSCVLDFKKLMLEIINEGGDADTNAAVAGSVLGCYLGYANLPKDWLSCLIHKKWLDEKIYIFVKKIAM